MTKRASLTKGNAKKARQLSDLGYWRTPFNGSAVLRSAPALRVIGLLQHPLSNPLTGSEGNAYDTRRGP